MTGLGWFACAVTLAVVIGLASDRLPPHRIALGGFALLLLAGAVDAASALSVIGSTGLVTVACMFVLAAALEQTGVVDDAVRRLLRLARTRPRTAWSWFFGLVLLGSTVIPNTPVVVLACPAALLLAQRTRTPRSRVLLPIAYLATLGGSLTLIGSSVNVVASELAREHGAPPFDIFGLLPVALPTALVGASCLMLLARWLPRGEITSPRLYNPEQGFLFELTVGHAEGLAGKPLCDTLMADAGMQVVEFYTDGGGPTSRRHAAGLAGFRPAVGDRLLLRASASRLVEREQASRFGDQPAPLILEVWIPAYSRLRGLRVEQLRLDHIHGIRVLGVAPLVGHVADLSAHRIVTGDRLLLCGPRDEVERFLASEAAFGPLQIERSKQARDRAPHALAALAFVVLAPASGWLALEVAALVAAVSLAVGGALRGGFVLSPLLLRTLGVLLGMLGIGIALEQTGATFAMVAPLIELAADLGPWTLLFTVYVIASLLSEFITNNAVVVLLMPLALGVVQSLGLDPYPFALAVLFGASASFASPIGYQTNTLVYQLGDYRFADFLRVGLPLKLIVGIVVLALIGGLYPPMLR